MGYGAAYRIRFVVPAGDGMREVAVTAGDRKSNAVVFPVGRAMQNLSAPSFGARAAAAPESILAAYQCSGEVFVRRADVVWGATPDLPTSLAGITIKVRDSAGVERLAPLYGVSSSQVNYVVPAATAKGLATVTAVADGREIAEADLEIETVAPDLFQAVQVVRVRNGVQTVEEGPVIDMGPDTDQVYLVSYGSGIRYRSSLEQVTGSIGGISVPVLYAGPQGQEPGLDQVNVQLPRSLAGLGSARLDLVVEGKRIAMALLFR